MKLAFLTYNRDPAIPEVDNDGNPITVRNYSYWLSKWGNTIDIYVNRVIPDGSSGEYIKKKFLLQKSDSIDLFQGVKVIRINTPDLTAKELCKSPELQEIPEITQSILSAEFFKKNQLSEYDLICVFHPLTSFGVIFRDFLPLNNTLLFPMLLSDEYLKFGSVSPIYIQLEQVVLEKVSKIFCTSHSEEGTLISRKIDKSKIRVIPRGIDLNSFEFIAKTLTDNKKNLNLITVGSIRPQKRQHILINTVKILLSKGIDVNLKIVGEDKFFTKLEYKKYYEDIQSEIVKHGLSTKIKFTGSVDPKELSHLLNTSDIALFPSISESFGKAALESICVGTPTILAKECLAYSDFAIDAKNALLVPSASESMSNSILKLLGNKELYSKISSEGANTREKFSWEIVSDTLHHFLLNEVDQKS